LKPLSGTFYRLKETARAGEILAPAHSPEGRFHHDRQKAIYLSETREGYRVAMSYYARPGDAPQTMFALHLSAARILDLRDARQCTRFAIDPANSNIRWQKERAAGQIASTWAISDAARAAGADGMLNPSRSRPGLTHLVLFRWNQPGAPDLRLTKLN